MASTRPALPRLQPILLGIGFAVLIAISAATVFLVDRASTDAQSVSHTISVESKLSNLLLAVRRHSHEFEGRGQPDGDVPAHFLPKHPLGLFEPFGGVGLDGLVAKDRVVNSGVLQIVGHPGIGDSNALKPRILGLPAQSFSNNNLNPLRQLGSTCRISHEQLL